MKHTSLTRIPRTKRVASIVGLGIFFLLMALTMNFNGPVKLAYAAALKPATTPTLPSVAITSPANNAVVGQYTALPITASFSVAHPSTITKVEFYASLNGGTTTLIGTATTAPQLPGPCNWLIL
jgi:hypothetical protein